MKIDFLGFANRKEYFIFGLLVPKFITLLTMFILSLFLSDNPLQFYSELFNQILSSASNFSFSIKTEDFILSDNLSRTAITLSVIFFFISTLYSFLLAFSYNVKRIRDMFGCFKLRYLVLIDCGGLIPIIGPLFICIPFITPGRISSKSKVMDPIINVIG